ncbi:ABC transporter permease [Candidatus Saccharibacteria bacterium]|nr:ABC transporter permease [Candidatus Saccharibacteria bacterium]
MNEIAIKPRKRLAINIKELFAYHELFFYFAWRDVKVRYKQTAIGISWAVLQPFVQMVVFTLFFNKAAGITSGNSAVPYAIFSFTGLLFWNFFSSALTRASNSLVDNQAVVTKVYFPRLILPLSSTLIGLIDFCFAFVIFVGLLVYFKFPPTWQAVALLIPALLITFIAASGVGMYLAAVNVKYRDVKQAVPFLVQVGLFVTPVIYPVTAIPQKYQWILYLNPMTGVINMMRSSFLHTTPINWPLTWLSIGVAGLSFVVGLIYFKFKEKEFADII